MAHFRGLNLTLHAIQVPDVQISWLWTRLYRQLLESCSHLALLSVQIIVSCPFFNCQSALLCLSPDLQ